ncbi:MAG: NAD(+) synthase [Caldilineaceae bacterium]
MTHPFYSLYTHGFLRTAVCIPYLRVADPGYNADRTLAMAQRAAAQQAAVVLFPELGLAAYSSDDLFHQDALLAAVVAGLQRVVDGSRDLPSVLLVGAPLLFEGKLFNCAAVIYRGQILGLVPKSYLPNYREFYEKRQFTAARSAVQQEVQLLGQTVPFGNDLIFDAVNVPNFVLHTEICEDVWAPLPPSTFAALAGATVLANLSASNITIGKADYRHQLCAGQSARCLAAYLYSAAGFGESTTDLAWDGHALIYENGELLAESERCAAEEQLIMGDIDLERLAQERMRLTSYNDAIHDHRTAIRALRRIPFRFAMPHEVVPLQRHVERFPYVPSNPRVRDERCFEAYNIQVQGLMKRLDATGIKQVVIGVSGGLDSTHALIVAARTMDRLGLPRTNILAYTMPGFATTDRTKSNAWKLMEALGVSAHEIDIRPSAMQMLRDLGHPFAEEEPLYDITFENVQAGERTSHLFRLANYNNALVLGTGDLSELALGWATYGVGDQMSHYNVNVSVPKTLIQYLIRWVIGTKQFSDETNDVLQSILDTEISPELVPATDSNSEQPAQSTEAKIGPYELQDFHLYYTTPTAFARAKWPSLPTMPGATRCRATGPTCCRPKSATSMTSPQSKNGSNSSSFASFRSANSSARPSPMGRRWGRAVRSRRAGTGAHQVIHLPRFGWRS